MGFLKSFFGAPTPQEQTPSFGDMLKAPSKESLREFIFRVKPNAPFLVFYVGKDGELKEDQFSLESRDKTRLEEVLKQVEALGAIVALVPDANSWDEETEIEIKKQEPVCSVINIYTQEQVPFSWALHKLVPTQEDPISPPLNNNREQVSEDTGEGTKNSQPQEQHKSAEEVFGYVLSVSLVKDKEDTEDKEDTYGGKKLLFRKVFPPQLALSSFKGEVNRVKEEFVFANRELQLQEGESLCLELERIVQKDVKLTIKDNGNPPPEDSV